MDHCDQCGSHSTTEFKEKRYKTGQVFEWEFIVKWAAGISAVVAAALRIANAPVAAIRVLTFSILLALIELLLWNHRRSPNATKLVVPVCVLVAILVLYGAHRLVRYASLPIETETHGWLIPDHEPEPENNPCKDDQRPSGSIMIFFGTAASWTEATHQSLVFVGGRELLSMDRKANGALAFNADVLDETGNLIARLRDGEFHLVAAEMAYPERSTDRSTLTVYDRKGNIVLYIHVLNPTTVVVRGTFNGPGGRRVVASKDKLFIGTEHGGITLGGANCFSTGRGSISPFLFAF